MMTRINASNWHDEYRLRSMLSQLAYNSKQIIVTTTNPITTEENPCGYKGFMSIHMNQQHGVLQTVKC